MDKEALERIADVAEINPLLAGAVLEELYKLGYRKLPEGKLPQGFNEGVQAVIDYLKREIATVEERSAGEPKLKAHFNAMEKGILGTVVYVLEEWQESPKG